LRVGEANFTFHKRMKVVCEECFFKGVLHGGMPLQENLKKGSVYRAGTGFRK